MTAKWESFYRQTTIGLLSALISIVAFVSVATFNRIGEIEKNAFSKLDKMQEEIVSIKIKMAKLEGVRLANVQEKDPLLNPREEGLLN